jgi:hypothetical protein
VSPFQKPPAPPRPSTHPLIGSTPRLYAASSRCCHHRNDNHVHVALLPLGSLEPRATAVKLAQFCCEGFDEESRKTARRVYKQFWRSVMITRKPGTQALSISTSSTISSPASSLAEFDDVKMAMSDVQPTPLTVSIPKNIPSPHCRKPNLSEILANTAPPPYTLSSFMAFLSQNHCLENLEFTMDASRYRKHYSKMVNRHPGSPISPLSDECTYVLMLWRRLIDAYIRESGPREVSDYYYRPAVIVRMTNLPRSTFQPKSVTTSSACQTRMSHRIPRRWTRRCRRSTS